MSGLVTLFCSLYFIVSRTRSIKKLSATGEWRYFPITLYSDGANCLQASRVSCRKLSVSTCLPIFRNSLSSSSSAFILIPNAQLPITSVVNFAATSRHSTGSPLSATLSRNFSKFPAHSTMRGNISLSLPDVNIGDSFCLSGFHLSDSKKNRCCVSGSI